VPPGPDIDLAVGNQSLGDGGTLNFGSTPQGTSLTKTITITNQGTTRLKLTPVNAASTPSGFSLLMNIDSLSLAPGESTSFTIRFDAKTAGPLSGAIQLVNNDSDESSYDVNLSGMTPQIFDDGNAGNMLVGPWRRQGGSGYNHDVHYVSAGSGSSYSTWTFSGLSPGQYRVHATWTTNRKNASNAPFMLLDGTAMRSVAYVNQRLAPRDSTSAGSRWKLLGAITVNSGQLIVKLANAANGRIVADAVRIVQVSSVIPPPEINANNASATSISASQSTVPIQAALTAGTADSQAVDGVLTRLAQERTYSPSNGIDLLASEHTSPPVATSDRADVLGRALTSLLTDELAPLAR